MTTPGDSCPGCRRRHGRHERKERNEPNEPNEAVLAGANLGSKRNPLSVHMAPIAEIDGNMPNIYGYCGFWAISK